MPTVIGPDSWELMPWRNGKGFTNEIYKLSDDRGLLFRISAATVSSDGPFSCFSGINRFIAVLKGDGLRLSLEDGSHAVVDRNHGYYFSGDVKVESSLLNGEVLDFNVMTRQEEYRTEVQLLNEFSDASLDSGSFLSFLFAADDAVTLRLSDGSTLELPALHLFKWEVGVVKLVSSASARVFYIKCDKIVQ